MVHWNDMAALNEAERTAAAAEAKKDEEEEFINFSSRKLTD